MLPLSTVLLLLFAAAVNPLKAAPPNQSADVKKLWETVLQEEANEVELKASTVSIKNGVVWLALGRRAAGTLGGPQSLALRTLDNANGGKTLAEVSVEALAKTAALPLVPDKVVDVAATPDGNVALLLGSVNQLWLLTLDGKSGRVLQKKEIKAQKPELLITRLLSTPSGSLLLIGRSGARGVVLKFDRSLAGTWESLSSPDDVSVFLDGAVFTDETFVLAGAHAPKPGTSVPVSLWLGQFSAAGKALNSISVPGRFASLAAARDGGCAMVSDAPGTQATDYWFRSYDRNLKETWSVKLLSGPPVPQPFRLAALAAAPGDFVIAGSEKQRAWMARVRAGASILWHQASTESPGQMPQLFWNAGLAPSADGVVVAFTEMVVNAKMQQRQTVRVTSLDTR